MRAAIRCGENSLEVYCIGVILVLGGQMLLEYVSRGIAMQIIVSVGGVLILIAFATFMTWVRINSRQQPKLF